MFFSKLNWNFKKLTCLSVADKMPTKYKFFLKQVFCLLFFKGCFTSVFIDKKSKRSHKIVEINFFLTFFACWWKDPDPYKIMTDPDPGGPKTYGSRSRSITLLRVNHTMKLCQQTINNENVVKQLKTNCFETQLEYFRNIFVRIYLHKWNRIRKNKNTETKHCTVYF